MTSPDSLIINTPTTELLDTLAADTVAADTVLSDSLAADTLLVDSAPPVALRRELPAQDSIVLEQCYTLGYFKGDSLLHPEMEPRQNGFAGEPLAYQLKRDDWIGGLIFLCALLYIFIIRYTGRRFVQQARQFFLPTRERSGLFAESTSLEKHSSMMVSVMVSLVFGMAFFVYAQSTMEIFMGLFSPYLLIPVYTGCCLAYFIVKYWLYAFINWIFFDTTDRRNWNESYAFLISTECFAFFPIIIICVYFELPLDFALRALLLFAVIIKILFVLKTFQVFFGKFNGVLHLLLYLCTLEAMPLLALFKSAVVVTDCLMIKS